jgi:hypothetical protein
MPGSSRGVSAARTARGQFPKGVSGNPKGRPRGSRNVMPSVRELVAVALRDPAHIPPRR